jgi:hypothetical protein
MAGVRGGGGVSDKFSLSGFHAEDSSSFERAIEEVYRILSDASDSVERNVRVADPDFEGFFRQIDLRIKSIGLTTHVECRFHKKKQDVKWIEELIGRKASLRPDVMIAVSSSGFTPLAVLKASKHEIHLREFSELDSDEIASWPGGALVSVRCLKVHQLSLILCSVTPLCRAQADSIASQFIGGKWLFEPLHVVAKRICSARSSGELLPFSAPVLFSGSLKRILEYCAVRSIEISGIVEVVDVETICGSLSRFSGAERDCEDAVKFARSDRIEAGLAMGRTSARFFLDLAKLRLPADYVFSGDVRIKMGDKVNADSIKLFNPIIPGTILYNFRLVNRVDG